ncbi:MAG TPA: carbohydrate ABC transporter permease [Micromonosporaceae bacterium]|jgi:N,N'-diacetylchitobiose transport system permease protein|nr:carbohydrate ABC transporter permease [Micromonosporaceae bacterium]
MNLTHRARGRARRAVANGAGVLISVVMLFPVYWMVLTAFKPSSEILTFEPTFLPSELTVDSFSRAVSAPHFWDAVRNSLVVAGTVTVIAVAVAFLAAVAIARFRFYGRRGFVFAILVVQMVPLNAMIIPIYLLLNEVDQVNRLSGVVITYLSFVLPFTVWTLRGFVANVPKELEEAAMMDGCTRLEAFWRVVLPLVFPGLVATSMYALIQAWNEYVMAYVLLSDQSKETLPVWLVSFVTARGIDYGALMAGATLMSLPVIVFFVIIQRQVVSGLVAGAVKG